MTVLSHAENFDSMIDQMLEKYFTLPLTSTTRLENIIPDTQLDSQQIVQEARFQLLRREEEVACVLWHLS